MAINNRLIISVSDVNSLLYKLESRFHNILKKSKTKGENYLVLSTAFPGIKEVVFCHNVLKIDMDLICIICNASCFGDAIACFPQHFDEDYSEQKIAKNSKYHTITKLDVESIYLPRITFLSLEDAFDVEKEGKSLVNAMKRFIILDDKLPHCVFALANDAGEDGYKEIIDLCKHLSNSFKIKCFNIYNVLENDRYALYSEF